jgi:hypothetical protein
VRLSTARASSEAILSIEPPIQPAHAGCRFLDRRRIAPVAVYCHRSPLNPGVGADLLIITMSKAWTPFPRYYSFAIGNLSTIYAWAQMLENPFGQLLQLHCLFVGFIHKFHGRPFNAFNLYFG